MKSPWDNGRSELGRRPGVVVVFPAKQTETVETGLGYGGIYRAALAQVEALLRADLKVFVLTASTLFARRCEAMGATVDLGNEWHSGVSPLLKPRCWAAAWRTRTRSSLVAVIFHGGRGWVWGACFFPSVARVGVMHTGGLGKTKRLRFQLALNARALEAARKNRLGKKMRFGLVPNGLTSGDLARFGAVAEKRKQRDRSEGLVVGFVGRFAPSKGLDVLLAAVRQLKVDGLTLKVLLAGAGELDVDSMVRDAGLTDCVQSVGWTSDIAGFFERLDVFCLPSRDEPFGMVVLEAMASGVAVVATRSGGPEEIIEAGVTGLLVPPGDVGELAAALRRLTNADERSVLAEAATRTLNARFGPAAVGRAYLGALRSIGLYVPPIGRD